VHGTRIRVVFVVLSGRSGDRKGPALLQVPLSTALGLVSAYSPFCICVPASSRKACPRHCPHPYCQCSRVGLLRLFRSNRPALGLCDRLQLSTATDRNSQPASCLNTMRTTIVIFPATLSFVHASTDPSLGQAQNCSVLRKHF
jgi:hypothetical protein